MDELEVIEKLGIAKSSTIHLMIDKSIVNTIKQLNSLEKVGEIKVVVLSKPFKGMRKVYMKNEVYRDMFEN